MLHQLIARVHARVRSYIIGNIRSKMPLSSLSKWI